MKRMWKKMAALLMMMAMVLVMGTAAGAETLSVDSNDGNKVTNTTSVSITSVPNDAANLSYSTYQVIYATYDSTSNSFEWYLTDWAKSALVGDSGKLYTTELAALTDIFALTGSDGTGLEGQSQGTSTTEQNTIVNTLAAYIADSTNAVSAIGTIWSTSGTTSSATLAVGAYLVIPSATNMSFLNMLVSVDVSGTTETSASDWTPTSHGAVLKGNKLTIEKTVSDTENGTYGASADTQIGATVYYQVKVNVPKFAANDSEKSFTVVDVANNLKIDSTSVVVTPYDSSDKAGTALTLYNGKTDSDSNALTAGYALNVSTSNNTDTMTVTFTGYYDNVFYNSSAKTYPYEYVIISYEAELLSSAVTYTSNGNDNTATLTYDYDNHTSNTASSKATVYTYALDLTKYGANTSGTTLANASFKIYYYDNSGTAKYLRFIKNTDGSFSVADSTDEADSTVTKYDAVTTTLTGTLTLTGLDDDVDYFIVESVAPSGYSLNTNILNFKIAESSTAAGTIDAVTSYEYAAYTYSGSNTALSSDKTTWTAAKETTTTNSAKLTLSVTDTKIAALPATGSIGIIVFTIAGVAIMILALVLINSGKNKAKKA
ncbi:MAG: LPXTG cell wall anchor domain-containing protein [Lachnospiraceae bacterium]|nr:LPXTG cell wall anchor domain-containing protein [Lachnospiraceae bacterium]